MAMTSILLGLALAMGGVGFGLGRGTAGGPVVEDLSLISNEGTAAGGSLLGNIGGALLPLLLIVWAMNSQQNQRSQTPVIVVDSD